MDESPALTTSTNMSSPDFVTAASPAHIKPRLVAIRDKPQPPIPTSEEPEMVATPPPTSSAPTSKQPVRNSIRRVPVKNGSTSTNEFADPLSQETSMQRRPTASSLPSLSLSLDPRNSAAKTSTRQNVKFPALAETKQRRLQRAQPTLDLVSRHQRRLRPQELPMAPTILHEQQSQRPQTPQVKQRDVSNKLHR